MRRANTACFAVCTCRANKRHRYTSTSSSRLVSFCFERAAHVGKERAIAVLVVVMVVVMVLLLVLVVLVFLLLVLLFVVAVMVGVVVVVVVGGGGGGDVIG